MNKINPDGDLIGSTALLTIDLTAIGENYAILSALGKGAQCAAVVKANAYGTGVSQVATYLQAQGCKTFFVATLDEGIALRDRLPDVSIFILDGLFPASSPMFLQHNLSPVLGSMEMLKEWSVSIRTSSTPPTAALHIDTGMNRLGIGPDQFEQLLDTDVLKNIKLDLIMSHLACADEPDNSRNQKQLEQFKSALEKLPSVPVSFANSSGIFLGSDYHFDLLRPGVALYGGRPNDRSDNAMHPVVTLTTRIAQIRTVEKGDAIGYGAFYVATRKTRLATLPVGYADGYPRALGSSNECKGASTYIGEYEAPLLGRVSMDLITIDITDIPEDKAILGADVELLGSHILVDDLADIAGTISYEILTSLGARYDRHYKGAD